MAVRANASMSIMRPARQFWCPCSHLAKAATSLVNSMAVKMTRTWNDGMVMFTAINMSVMIVFGKGGSGAKVAYLPRVMSSSKQNAKPFFRKLHFSIVCSVTTKREININLVNWRYRGYSEDCCQAEPKSKHCYTNLPTLLAAAIEHLNHASWDSVFHLRSSSESACTHTICLLHTSQWNNKQSTFLASQSALDWASCQPQFNKYAPLKIAVMLSQNPNFATLTCPLRRLQPINTWITHPGTLFFIYDRHLNLHVLTLYVCSIPASGIINKVPLWLLEVLWIEHLVSHSSISTHILLYIIIDLWWELGSD